MEKHTITPTLDNSVHNSSKTIRNETRDTTIFILRNMYIKCNLINQQEANQWVIIKLILTGNNLIASDNPPLIVVGKPRRVHDLDTLAQANHIGALPPSRYGMLG